MALYGAPIWADTLRSKSEALLRRPQRAIVLRVARAYRDNSYAAASLLAGSPPWDLEAKVQTAVYWRVTAARREENWPAPQEIQKWREEAREVLFERLEIPGASREPERSGRCSARSKRMGGTAVDTAQHTREECPAWDEPRAALFTVIGGDLSLPALIRHMLSSEEEWEAVTTFSVIVMTQKEAAEKVRELSAAEGQAGGEESSQRLMPP
ncbi:uncharacterized protein LOC125240436 [Leguminivora glycinivorella]|uniref:uncharacterized protein LOC125240436 n=1 Tax=Leguminivora glycinivorella TaxID=1035111 RepID=UPI00200F9139|nr:uncharacterized protein LOC125240436 [Leguminivora glycinivorella]